MRQTCPSRGSNVTHSCCQPHIKMCIWVRSWQGGGKSWHNRSCSKCCIPTQTEEEVKPRIKNTYNYFSAWCSSFIFFTLWTRSKPFPRFRWTPIRLRIEIQHRVMIRWKIWVRDTYVLHNNLKLAYSSVISEISCQPVQNILDACFNYLHCHLWIVLNHYQIPCQSKKTQNKFLLKYLISYY